MGFFLMFLLWYFYEHLKLFKQQTKMEKSLNGRIAHNIQYVHMIIN